jgi:hypothetical protein
VLRAGVPVRVEVQTGLSDGTSTAITGGELREGDLVITGDSSAKTPSPGAAGGTRPASAGARGGRRGAPSLF